MTFRLAPRAALLVGLAVLPGCYNRPPPSRAEQAALNACRRRADQIFLEQNRAYLSERDTRDSPFASSGLTGITSEGLGDRYGRDEMVASCLNGADLGASGRAAANPGIDRGTGPAMSPAARGDVVPGMAP